MRFLAILAVGFCCISSVASAQSEQCSGLILFFEPEQTQLDATNKAILLQAVQNCHQHGQTRWSFTAEYDPSRGPGEARDSGARLFDIRFFMVGNGGVDSKQLELSNLAVENQTSKSRVVVEIIDPKTDHCTDGEQALVENQLMFESDCGPGCRILRVDRHGNILECESPSVFQESISNEHTPLMLSKDNAPIPSIRGADIPEHLQGYEEEKFFLDSQKAYQDFLQGRPGQTPSLASRDCGQGPEFDLQANWDEQNGPNLIRQFIVDCYRSSMDLLRFEFKSETPIPLANQMIWQEWINNQIRTSATDISVDWGVSFTQVKEHEMPALSISIRSPEFSQ